MTDAKGLPAKGLPTTRMRARRARGRPARGLARRVLAVPLLLGFGLGAGPALAGVADGTVRVGVLNDQSGIYSDIGGPGSTVAARLAVEDFGGKVLGVPIEVIAADHQNKADVASATARRWYDVDKVDVILDGASSLAASAIQGVATQQRRAFLITGAGSSDLTGKTCSPYTLHFTYDTYALAKGTAAATVRRGGTSWFFVTADYSFGQALERDATALVTQEGGKVVGSVRAPVASSDFSSYLLQAQGSGAKVIGLANAGADTINAIKQAAEFGIAEGGQSLAGLLVFFSDARSLGVRVAHGLLLTESFYWDLNDETRAFSKRFAQAFGGKMPTMVHAGTYTAVLHYLRAMQAAGTDEAGAVLAKMRATPINDMNNRDVAIRPDGRVLHTMYVFEVKSPAESKSGNDLYKLVATIPGAEAFRPLSEGGCPLVGAGR